MPPANPESMRSALLVSSWSITRLSSAWLYTPTVRVFGYFDPVPWNEVYLMVVFAAPETMLIAHVSPVFVKLLFSIVTFFVLMVNPLDDTALMVQGPLAEQL